MSPSHPDRVRRNYPVECQHYWIFLNHSDVGPLIESDRTRTSYQGCFNCGAVRSYNRPEAVFVKELWSDYQLDTDSLNWSEPFRGSPTESGGFKVIKASTDSDSS